jgi:UDP-N-acetylmuramoyl-tripeptide--D-alanyl-D-alanine ligase
MVRPQFGVLTNIGREHLEFFENLAGVAQEEGWLAELLPAGGKLFLNGDNEWAGHIASRTRAQVIRVGLSPGNDWRARDLRVNHRGIAFEVDTPRADLSGGFKVNLLGRHQVLNALFAMAVGSELGLNRAEIRAGLAECQAPKMRMQLWEANGVQVLDDAYNANADSMEAALQTLRELPCAGRRVAVLGDMAELGAQSVAAHEEVGRRAAELGVEQLFLVGKMAGTLAGAARAAGLVRIFEFGDVESAASAVKRFVKPGDVVLLKASRVMRLERLAEVLRA